MLFAYGLNQSISHMSDQERTVFKGYLNKEFKYITSNPTDNATYYSIYSTIHDFHIPKPNDEDTVIIPANSATITSGRALRFDRIMQSKRAGMYTGMLDDNNIKNVRFKNKMRRQIDEIDNNALYTQIRDLSTFHLTTKKEMLEYLVILYY